MTRVSELFAASDAAICPRQDGGTSGALILALSMGVPGHRGRGPELRGDHRRGGGRLACTSPMTWARWSRRSSARRRNPRAAAEKGAAGLRLVEPLSWENMARRSAELLHASLA